MASIASLWLPIVVSAVIVFIVSSIIHMSTPFHKGDMKDLPREDDVMNALRPFGIQPGRLRNAARGLDGGHAVGRVHEKMRKGPVAFMTVRPPGEVSMTSSLVLWFLYSIVVSFFAATWRAPPRARHRLSSLPDRRLRVVHGVFTGSSSRLDLVEPKLGQRRSGR